MINLLDRHFLARPVTSMLDQKMRFLVLMIIILSLSIAQLYAADDNENNIDELRVQMEGWRKIIIKHYRRVLKAHDEGTMKQIDFKWLPQANIDEEYNKIK